MRLVTFLPVPKEQGEATVDGGAYLQGARPGVLLEDAVLDLGGEFTDLTALIAGGQQALRTVQALAAAVGGGDNSPAFPLAAVQLLAPIPQPRRNIFCVGWNYLAHFHEGQGRRGIADDEELPRHPTFFTKATTAANGPEAPILWRPEWTERLDYEAELAVVIGRQGRDIPAAEALDYVFGYMAANDLSARDLQRRHGGQWVKGKSLDGSCPMGPWLVPAAYIPDPQQLDISCRVNGQLRQQASTGQMIFTVAEIIAELSHGMTLLPGDIILTGTPEGVGFAMDPPAYLQPGDEIEVEISGLGRLKNRVVQVD